MSPAPRKRKASRAGSEVAAIARRLSQELASLSFGPPVTHVYDPSDYAARSHEAYLSRFAGLGADVLMLGMNPGPYGMVQTGVPFGEVAAARDWLGIEEPVKRPASEHPKRPITGFDCPRSEVSGRRLWGWAARRFGTPEAFFERFFVWNYCPLAFLEEGGRNRTPDKLTAAEREPLYDACDRALSAVVTTLGFSRVLGIGAFAEARARSALADADLTFGRVLHPSPASPLANRGWEPAVEKQLAEQGLALP